MHDKITSKINHFLAASVISILAVVGFTAAPAQAAWSDCSNYPGTICLFANTNWGLPIWRQYPWQIDGCRDLTGFDNVTTIAANTAGHHTLILWQFPGCEGESLVITSGNYSNFSNTWWNDKASAVEVIAF